VPDSAVQLDDPPGVDWRGRITGGVAVVVALAVSVVVLAGRAHRRRRDAVAWSGWVRQ
jgi:hypothetical protein